MQGVQEIRGAFGYEETARPRWQPTRTYPPYHVVIELGSDDRRWRHGWKTVGLVVFDQHGRRRRSKVDGMTAHLVELEVRREREAAGLVSEDQSITAILDGFVARYVEAIADFGILDELRRHPQHVPIPSLAVLRVSELRDHEDFRGIPHGWDHYLL